nr:sporulation integral membrane protein YtvI [Alkalibacter mobilis]
MISVAGIILFTWLFFKIFPYIAPFVFAILLTFAIEPLVKLLVNKKIPRKLASLIVVFVLLALILFLLVFIISRVYSQARDFLETVPNLINEAYAIITSLLDSGNSIFIELPEELANFMSEVFESLLGYGGELINQAVNSILDIAISIPAAIIFTFMMIISTYFLSSDIIRIRRFINIQIPVFLIGKFNAVKINIQNSVLKLMKAYLIIMSVTFTELIIGFTILDVKYGLALAAIIAVADILPVVGTGGFLIPWAIFSFLNEDFTRGISLLVIYGVVMLIRQIIEPKIVGTQIGVHPVLTLGSMYIGIKAFGGIGIIMGPVIFLVLKSVSQVVFKHQTLKELLLLDRD